MTQVLSVSQLADLLDKVGTVATNSTAFQEALLRSLSEIISNNATRVKSQVSSSTLTPNVDDYDMFTLSAQAEALVITNPTGTPSEGNAFVVRITSAGAYAISFDTNYRAFGSALVATTTSNKTLYITCVYNSLADKYDVFPSQLEV